MTTASEIGQTRPLKQKERSLNLGQVAGHVILMVVVVMNLLPIVWLVFASFKTYQDLTNNPWWPRPWTVANFQTILGRLNFPRAFLNSVIVAVPRVLLACLTSTATGYVFAKYEFPGRDILFVLLLSTMMVPFVVIMIPLYITLADLGLVNKLISLVIIAFFSTMGTFLLRQSIRDIPDDLMDAARIDGAGEFWIYSRLIVPLSKGPMSALAIFAFLTSWDSFMFPSIVLTDPKVKTLPLVLAGMQGIYWDRYELYAAGAMLTVVPVMILYAFMQRQFIEGITMTGFK